MSRHRPMVDVAETRAHIRKLRKRMSARAIALTAGVSKDTIHTIESGARDRIRQDTAEAICSVVAPPARSRFKVPAGPTLDLIDALAKRMSKAEIARAVGVRPNSLPRRTRDGRTARTVTQRMAEAVRELAIARGVIRRSPGEALYALDGAAFDFLIEVTGAEVEAICEAAGLTRESYLQFRCGRLATEDTIERLARALCVSPARLIAERSEHAAA